MTQMNLAHSLDNKNRSRDVILDQNVSFESLLLPKVILSGLTNNGFRIPSPIQFKAVPLGRCGFDLIVKSKSGTGKTLIFSLVALEIVDISRPDLQVLILVPTREIAVQIEGVLRSVGNCIEGLRVESFIGGLPLEDDIKKARGCHIAVGAPGRIKHLISDKHLPTNQIRLLVLDEADKLMEKSFQADINEMFHILPERKQLIASSATYPKELDLFLAKYMLSPTHVNAEIETPVLLGLKQFASIINSSSNAVQMMKAKNEALIQILSKVPFTQCLVFSNYQTRAESVSNILQQKGWNSAFISAAQSQHKRLQILNDLKEFKCKVLLSTDLTARGIDAANVDLVVNYDIPHDAVTYLHRMGRAGRYGAPGICINLVLPGDDLKQLQNILGAIGSTQLSVSKLPDLNEKALDLWNIEAENLEQIYGIVDKTSENMNNDIKKEIQAFKKNCGQKNKQLHKKKDGKTKIESTETLSLESIHVDIVGNILNNNKDLIENSSAKSETGDSVQLDTSNNKVEQQISLDSIGINVIGNILNNNKRMAEIDNKYMKLESNGCDFYQRGDVIFDLSSDNSLELEETNCQPKMEIESQFQNSLDMIDVNLITKVLNDTKYEISQKITTIQEDKKKRKRESADSIFSQEMHKEKRKLVNSNINFCRNKALYHVAKLLCHVNTEIDNDIVEAIRDYILLIKINFEECYTGNPLTVKQEVPLASTSTTSPLQAGPSGSNPLNKFFEIAYDYALGQKEKHWLEYFTEEEVEEFQQLCLKETTIISEDDEDIEYDNEDETEEDFEMNEEPQLQDNSVVVQSHLGEVQSQLPETSSPINEDMSEHFVQCYEDCSNTLWQHGLTFESVNDFDNWYYQWQEKLQSVRDYVQQNIYVQEMSKYQQSRFNM